MLKEKELSRRQTEVVKYISEYQETNGYPPSFREIAMSTGFSLSTIAGILRTLRLKGVIAWKENMYRTLRIIM
jgi:SOS-response transcriptional repressor LexA